MKQTKFLTSYIIVFIIVLGAIFAGLSLYKMSLNAQLEQSTRSTLSEIAEQQAFSFSSKIIGEADSIKTMAVVFSKLERNEESFIVKTLKEATVTTQFEMITLVNAKGEGITSEGVKVNLVQFDFFQSALAGKTVFSKPFKSNVRDATVVALATPIYEDDKITGVLVGSYIASYLDTLFKTFYGGSGYAYVIDQSGYIISRQTTRYNLTGSDNYFDTLANANIYKYDDMQAIASNMKQGLSGYTMYEYKGQKRLAYYSPLNVNDWYLVSIVSSDAVASQANKITSYTNVLIAVLAVIFVAFIIYIIVTQGIASKKIVETMKRYDIVTEQSSGVVFEYDFSKNSVSFSSGSEKLFGQSVESNIFLDKDARFVHPDDMHVYNRLVEDIKSGVASTKAEIRFKYVSEDYVWCLVTFTMVFDSSGHAVKGIGQIADMSYTDKVTGAINRTKFDIDATKLLVNSDKKFAFVLFDVEKFKAFNEYYGHDEGDKLLRHIAKVLSEKLDKDEPFTRCFSDQFFALLEFKSYEEIKERLEKIFEEISSYCDNGKCYNIAMSAGVFVLEEGVSSINAISDRARLAQTPVKGCKTSSISFYNDNIRSKMLKEQEIESKMENAIENEQYLLYLQPKYSLEDEKIVGAEALVRWQLSDGKFIYPNEFIPLFEKNGFITQLDMYMFKKACSTLKEWQHKGFKLMPISINFSRNHLSNENFTKELKNIAEEYGVPTKYLEIEITETTMLDNELRLIEVLSELHSFGFTLSMDDFGTGYSSLGLLKNIPVDVLKLDRTFFTEYTDLVRARAVISSVINMAKTLSIDTVAEGVETKEHIDFLKELNCDIVQGYYYAKPMDVKAFNELYEKDSQ